MPVRKLVAIFSLLLLAACSGPDGNAQQQPPTEEEVADVWAEVVQCLADGGLNANVQRGLHGEWGVTVDGEVGRWDMFFTYDPCVADAEAVTRDYERSQIPEGEELVELAESFDSCIKAIGLKVPTYDLGAADQVTTLRQVTDQLPEAVLNGSIDDPRLGRVLNCFAAHEHLFPARFD